MKKAELEMRTVVIIILVLATLLVLIYYAFGASGGPLSLINSLLGFLNSTADYAQAAS